VASRPSSASRAASKGAPDDRRAPDLADEAAHSTPEASDRRAGESPPAGIKAFASSWGRRVDSPVSWQLSLAAPRLGVESDRGRVPRKTRGRLEKTERLPSSA